MAITRKLRQTIGCNIRPGFTPGGFCHRGMESQVSRRKKRNSETVKEHANAFLEKRGIRQPAFVPERECQPAIPAPTVVQPTP